MNSLLVTAILIIGLLVVPAACSQKGMTAQVKIAVVGDDVEEWRPTEVSVKAGGTVTWSNTGNLNHQVVSNEGLWNAQQIAPRGSFSYTFAKSGIYTYHDETDTWAGTVTVK